MNETPGAYRDAVIAFGLDYRPAQWLTLSTGLSTGGIYPVRVPLGAVLGTANGAYEAGFAMRDVLSLFGNDEPVISACTGVLRFRF